MSGLYNSASQPKGHLTRDHGPVYRCDGTGRDTYITYDNGGFNQPVYRAPIYAGTAYHQQLPYLNRYYMHAKRSPPPMHAKAINYRTDGSGRDTYIM